MPREGGEVETNNSGANKQSTGLSTQSHRRMSRRTFMKGAGYVALALGANRAADAIDVKGKVDRILGVSGKEQSRRNFTTGQMETDSQLASADSTAGLEQDKNTYSQKLDQAREEM